MQEARGKLRGCTCPVSQFLGVLSMGQDLHRSIHSSADTVATIYARLHANLSQYTSAALLLCMQAARGDTPARRPQSSARVSMLAAALRDQMSAANSDSGPAGEGVAAFAQAAPRLPGPHSPPVAAAAAQNGWPHFVFCGAPGKVSQALKSKCCMQQYDISSSAHECSIPSFI